MKSLHLLITGRVQGVGYRDWLVHEAQRRGLTGWVRNLATGAVEAVVAGEDKAVDDCVRLCWQGPPLADVSDVRVTETALPSETGFIRRRSVP